MTIVVANEVQILNQFVWFKYIASLCHQQFLDSLAFVGQQNRRQKSELNLSTIKQN